MAKLTAKAANNEEIAKHLSEAIQFKTISHFDPAQFDSKEFLGLHAYLEKTFPRVHAALTKEIVGELSLLYTWKGQEDGLKPILLMAHTDVVPVESGTEGDWIYPPFDGRIAEDYVWGRGALDDKFSVLGILEAVEALLEEGVQPKRTILLAFGHDEEVGGHNGATEIVAFLRSRGVELEYVIDEGMAVTEGIIPGISTPVALIGLTEKGGALLELTTEITGGHSLGTAQLTSVGILSTAIHKLEQYRFPPRLTGPIRQMFSTLAPKMPFLLRMVLGNLWISGGLVKRQLASSKTTEAAIRTTVMATAFNGSGEMAWAPPLRSTAVVRLSVLPGDSIDDSLERIRQIIGDPRVHIRVMKELPCREPSPVSTTSSWSYDVIQRTISQVFPGILVAPSITTAGTDSRHYTELSDNIYRFMPLLVNSEDLQRIHGINERLSLENCGKIVEFYIQLIRNSAL